MKPVFKQTACLILQTSCVCVPCVGFGYWLYPSLSSRPSAPGSAPCLKQIGGRCLSSLLCCRIITWGKLDTGEQRKWKDLDKIHFGVRCLFQPPGPFLMNCQHNDVTQLHGCRPWGWKLHWAGKRTFEAFYVVSMVMFNRI